MSAATRWLAPLILASVVAAGSAYAAVKMAGFEEGAHVNDFEHLESNFKGHSEDANIHLSISAAVDLERRLGSLEGAIDRLNDNMERALDDGEGGN